MHQQTNPTEYTHWAITRSGRLMPCRVVEEDLEWKTVKTTGGREYHYPKDNVIDYETGRIMLTELRVQDVLDNYQWERLSYRPAVYRVKDPKHPAVSNYVVTQGYQGNWTCTCPQYAKAGECKHGHAARLKTDAEAEETMRPKPTPKREAAPIVAWIGEW